MKTRLLLLLLSFVLCLHPSLSADSLVKTSLDSPPTTIIQVQGQLACLKGDRALHRVQRAIDNGELDGVFEALDEEIQAVENGGFLANCFTLEEFYGLLQRRREDAQRLHFGEGQSWTSLFQAYKTQKQAMSSQTQADLEALCHSKGRYQVSQRVSLLFQLKARLKPQAPEAFARIQDFLWCPKAHHHSPFSQELRRLGRSYEAKAWLIGHYANSHLQWEALWALRYALERQELQKLHFLLEGHPEHPLFPTVKTLQRTLADRYIYQWEKAYLRALSSGDAQVRNPVEQVVKHIYGNYLEARTELKRKICPA